MALLNRFSKLNDRAGTGIFTFIVTKSVTRDFHRDATTKDFCFGYHRWAISFQRPTEKVLGVHLLLRNPSPSTACVVDFTLTLLNREHFSQNKVYTKRQAKFTITNPMQGVSRWIQMSDLIDRHFSNETGEFLFELSLSNISTIFECDVQLNPATLGQYKCMLKSGTPASAAGRAASGCSSQAADSQSSANSNKQASGNQRGQSIELINLETNYFTFGAFDWSLTIVPLVIPSSVEQPSGGGSSSNSSSSTTQNNHLLTPNKLLSSSSMSIASSTAGPAQMKDCSKQRPGQQQPAAAKLEPVCRVYLNRLNGFDCLCRVKYRVILGHHQQQQGAAHSAEFVDSRILDQISDANGRIRGHQFRHTNVLKLISLRSSGAQPNELYLGGKQHHHHQQSGAGSLDLRVHIEMFCANTISECRVPLQRKPNEAQVSNCSDRNKQAWCVESDCETDNVRLKLFFMDLQSVPRNHIRYISWIAYVVKRDTKSGQMKESLAVRNSPHSNYYLQDGIDMGTIMDTSILARELSDSPKSYLESNQLTVHIEWVDSLLLFSHLYNNYDALATSQRHQISRELDALQEEFAHLEKKYLESKRSLSQLLNEPASHQAQQRQRLLEYSPTSSPSESSSPPLSIMSGQQNAAASERPETGEQQSDRTRSGSRQQQHFHASAGNHLSQPAGSGAKRELVSARRPSQSHIQGSSRPASSGQAKQWSWSDGPNHLSASSSAGYQRMGSAMSQEERIKFSSSTPPGHDQLAAMLQQQSDHYGSAANQPKQRRCLPAQPSPAPADYPIQGQPAHFNSNMALNDNCSINRPGAGEPGAAAQQLINQVESEQLDQRPAALEARLSSLQLGSSSAHSSPLHHLPRHAHHHRSASIVGARERAALGYPAPPETAFEPDKTEPAAKPDYLFEFSGSRRQLSAAGHAPAGPHRLHYEPLEPLYLFPGGALAKRNPAEFLYDQSAGAISRRPADFADSQPARREFAIDRYYE